jgi:hypothetical protein
MPVHPAASCHFFFIFSKIFLELNYYVDAVSEWLGRNRMGGASQEI